MIYITSDIHGKYSSLKIILEHVNFSENDQLIINGDLMDRGSELGLLIDFVLNNSNVDVILGNHEEMFLNACSSGFLTNKEIVEIETSSILTGKKYRYLESYDYNTNLWFSNGGDISYKTTSINDLRRLFEYLKDKKYYKIIDDNFIIHAGPYTLYSYDWTEKSFIDWINNQMIKDLIWDREFFLKQFLSNEPIEYPYNIFIGHNSIYNQNIEPYKIMKNGNILVNTDQSNNSDNYMNSLGLYCIETKTYYKLINDSLEELKVLAL
ncbi:fructose-bisphosphatase class III [Clostridium perfringens]|uniref:metallophosphoesterase n=1 Tax=Clostridium perfringens TaxID=1502 RepID=UPI00156F5DAC|nr:metallophosphoesterase [Clostridium perfringens]MDU7143494.1 metallophosphoesterase [Anaerococcus vaginalis]MDU7977643.1 metallophosphoesterase [Clostridioides difficile]MBI6024481.1 fructose-bisphosphatase class III [Clostridium perfringens]MBI6048532.1 fructose-bisphosphatase class III [Clostridium perfringens]MDK0553723.1 fructose-bisphosphatase class III [Clostridium perfringens]